VYQNTELRSETKVKTLKQRGRMKGESNEERQKERPLIRKSSANKEEDFDPNLETKGGREKGRFWERANSFAMGFPLKKSIHSERTIVEQN